MPAAEWQGKSSATIGGGTSVRRLLLSTVVLAARFAGLAVAALARLG